MSDTSSTYALNQPTSPTSGHNALRFAIDMAKQAMMTCTIVKVMKLRKDGNGAVGPIGRIDIMPLVQMVDGAQRTVKHVTVNNLPYFRLMGGQYAVICDPQVGDIGFVVVADRDISGVKNGQSQQGGQGGGGGGSGSGQGGGGDGTSPPGSNRRYNISDGFYVGACIAQKPSCYVRFVDKQTIELSPDGGETAVWIRPNRIDLGMKDAPHMVMTSDGPSQKVFAVISESGSKD